MERNKIFKHINCRDVAFRVMDISRTEIKTTCIGYWYNIVNPENEFLLVEDEIAINNNELSNWRPYSLRRK